MQNRIVTFFNYILTLLEVKILYPTRNMPKEGRGHRRYLWEVGVPRWRLSEKAGNFVAKTYGQGRRSRKENNEGKTTRQRRRQLKNCLQVVKDCLY